MNDNLPAVITDFDKRHWVGDDPLIPQDGYIDVAALQGPIRSMVDYCTASATRPQPELAVAATLVLLGVVAGGVYKSPNNGRTNLYIVGIAESGGGKETARKCVSRVVDAADINAYEGEEDLASGTAVVSMLAEHPRRILLLDEVWELIAAIGSKSKAASFQKEIGSNIMKLFSAAGSKYRGRAYANRTERPSVSINNPILGIYGTAVPGALWEGLSSADVEKGLVSRVLFVAAPESDPRCQSVRHEIEPPDDFIKLLVGLDIVLKEMCAAQGNASPEAIFTKYSPCGERAMQRVRNEEESARYLCKDRQYVRPIWARYIEQVDKISLILAINRNPGCPVVQAEDVEWARSFVRKSMHIVLTALHENVADTQSERDYKEMMKIISSLGPDWFSLTQIGEKARKIDPSKRAYLLNEFVDMEFLEREERKSPGAKKKTKVFRPTHKFYSRQSAA